MATPPLNIRPINADDVDAVLGLVERASTKYVVSDLSEKGIASLQGYNDPDALRDRMKRDHHQWVALSDGVLVGLVEVRNLAHISMLYVEPSFHLQGVGRELLLTALAECKKHANRGAKVTVNSSRYAKGFYERHGFERERAETNVNGVISVPMALKLDC